MRFLSFLTRLFRRRHRDDPMMTLHLHCEGPAAPMIHQGRRR